MQATVAEAAKELRVSIPTVHKLIHTQGLPHIRLGRRVIIPVTGWRNGWKNRCRLGSCVEYRPPDSGSVGFF